MAFLNDFNGNLPMKRPILCLLLFSLLAACAGSSLTQLEKATKAQSSTQGFNQDMAAEYLEFSQSEAELGHKETSEYFAKKGLAALKDDAQPETAEQWKIKGDKAQTITDARNRLIRLRTDFAKKVDSNSAARAQSLFDCWVVQEATADPKESVVPCHEEFLNTLQELEKTALPPKPKPRNQLPAHVTILFAPADAELDEDADFAIEQIMEAIADCKHYAITITGHTDGTGSQAKNREISLQRAENVATELKDRGVPAEAISVEAKGKSSPLIPTLDGIPQKRNRRVEVDVKRVEMPSEKPALETDTKNGDNHTTGVE